MRTPPKLASKLLERFRPHDDAAVGDLSEQFQAGRSSAWYWRQTLYVVSVAALDELRVQGGILLIAGAFSAAIALMTYVAFQQTFRHSADYPQVTMAEEAARLLRNGTAASTVVPSLHTDLRQSLSPFVIVFDENGKPISGSATLDGRVPTPPLGVFQFARTNAIEHRFTWQPTRGVRTAAVLRHFRGEQVQGFVLVGRSLRDVESRIALMTRTVMLVWVGSLSCLLAYFTLRSRRAAA